MSVIDCTLEACVETLAQAVAAQQKGAHRLELCERLDLDGLSPSFSLIEAVREAVNIPVKVMVRLRAGDFFYSSAEVAAMNDYASRAIQLGVDGIVIGALTTEGQIDKATTRFFCELASHCSLGVTFHKAFDSIQNPLAEIIDLQQLGVSAVLTSGKANTAHAGRLLLKDLVQTVAGDLEVIVAGKVANNNLYELHQFIHAPAYHGRKVVGELPSLP